MSNLSKLLFITCIFCFVFYSCNFGQSMIQPKSLSKKEWVDLFKTYYNVTPISKLEILFKNNKYYLPERWHFDNDSDCTMCNYYYYEINSTTCFLIMFNETPIGSYIFYLDLKNKKNSWSQINFFTDTINLYKVTNDLYYFELIDLNKIKEDELIRRYAFINTKTGTIIDSVIDTYISSLKVDSIDNDKHEIIFKLKKDNLSIDNYYITLDYRKLKFLNFINTPFYWREKTYYRYIKQVKGI